MLTVGPHRSHKQLLLGTAAGVALLWALVAWQPQAAWAEPVDNLQWLVAYAVAAWVAWAAVRSTPDAVDQRARRIFAIGLTLLLLAQLAYMAQLWLHMLPVLAPSDVLFVLPGLAYLLGFLSLMQRPDEPPVLRHVGLDVLGAATATLAFALALYLPNAPSKSSWALLTTVAFPVAYISAAVTAFITLLHSRQRFTVAGGAVAAALLALAVGWMVWNMALLHGPVPNGSPLGLLFSWAASPWACWC